MVWPYGLKKLSRALREFSNLFSLDDRGKRDLKSHFAETEAPRHKLILLRSCKY